MIKIEHRQRFTQVMPESLMKRHNRMTVVSGDGWAVSRESAHPQTYARDLDTYRLFLREEAIMKQGGMEGLKMIMTRLRALRYAGVL